ncbi:hypothetical protein GCM10010052_41380 [Paenarthrobacter histidinolovorans]|nr:hypothetical protein GCM10010052_41380 [Paenarthrobacter histidinolovorans]
MVAPQLISRSTKVEEVGRRWTASGDDGRGRDARIGIFVNENVETRLPPVGSRAQRSFGVARSNPATALSNEGL